MKHILEYNRFDGSYEVDDWVWIKLSSGDEVIGKVLKVDKSQPFSSYWYTIKPLVDIPNRITTGDNLRMVSEEDIKRHEIKKDTDKYNL